MRAWELPAKPFDEMKHYRLAIVLTGATASDQEPADRIYFHRGVDRVLHTVQLYQKGIVEKILISGGTGSLTGAPVPEADQFRQVMIMSGVPSEDIIIENKTRNTAESAIAVTEMLRRDGYSEGDCLLVTSAFHMRRSLACYRKAGFDLEHFTTDFYSHKRVYHLDAFIVPQVDAMVKWHKLFKEWIGMIAYKIVGYI